MKYNAQRALELLRIGTGDFKATFRGNQEDAIRLLIAQRSKLLVIQKTGWGKSFVYFITAKLLREQGTGPVLLVSPLLALMRNQLAAAQRMGLVAVTINSDNQSDWTEVEGKIAVNGVDILLISPERLANERFKERVLAKISDQVPLMVIDEAHCISDWGHDFRPHYRLIERILRDMPSGPRLLATTATANQRVQADLKQILGDDLQILRGNLDRPSLVLQTIELAQQAQRLAWLAQYVPGLPGSGIIYTLTIRDSELVARWLKGQGVNVESYTSDTGQRRSELEDALHKNELKALVATTALGMGYDKPDLGFVVHYQSPASVVAYYQQVGRAGRAIERAYGILLSGTEENTINDFFISSAFPSQEEVEKILAALEQNPGSIEQLQQVVNLRWSVISDALNLLSLESPAPVVKDKSVWSRTHVGLSQAFWERAERLTQLRRKEQLQMKEYVQLKSGHMNFLSQALDGPPVPDLSDQAPRFPALVDASRVTNAIAFLKDGPITIEPRKRWAQGSDPSVIRVGHRCEAGRVLSTWRDGGWGQMVYEGKYTQGHFADDLVEACAQMIKGWDPQPRPAWVTCVPSQKRPRLVPGFAIRLAQRLKLPFLDILVKTVDRAEQKFMSNSYQQMHNVQGSLGLTGNVPDSAGFLIDDVVDSRWTITVATWLLRSNGAGPIFPVVLSLAGGDA